MHIVQRVVRHIYFDKLNLRSLSFNVTTGDTNNYTHDFGIGAYHSGVQVGGREYTFAGGSGVFFHDPKDVPGEAIFRERYHQ